MYDMTSFIWKYRKVKAIVTNSDQWWPGVWGRGNFSEEDQEGNFRDFPEYGDSYMTVFLSG